MDSKSLELLFYEQKPFDLFLLSTKSVLFQSFIQLALVWRNTTPGYAFQLLRIVNEVLFFEK